MKKPVMWVAEHPDDYHVRQAAAFVLVSRMADSDGFLPSDWLCIMEQIMCEEAEDDT